MKQDDHERACMQQFLAPFSEVHIFLDQFHAKYPGFNHRRLLHHRQGVELCVQTFGEQARGPAEQHIRLDLNGHLLDSWIDYESHFLPLADEDERQRNDLIRLYGRQWVERIEG